LGRFQMNRCIVARDLALWHAMAPTMAPTKASHGMPWQPHGTQQGKPWHPARQAMACLGSPMAPTGACHDTHQGMPWHPPRHATNLGFVVPTGMPRHPSTKAGHGMPWHPPKAGQGTHQGRPWHATNLCLWCPWACHGTHIGWPWHATNLGL
jgi:hypothetical protein